MNGAGTPELCVVVLAAGRSHRLGRDKAMVSIRGVTLLQRTIGVLRAANAGPIVAMRIVVIRAPRQRRIASGVIAWRNNPDHARGISTSIRRGLRAARYSRAALIVAVDLPMLDPRELAYLLRAWRAAPARIIARRIGAHAGMPLILPKRHFGLGDGLRGEQGLASRLASIATDGIRLLRLNSAATDIDTGVDLGRARRDLRYRAVGKGALSWRRQAPHPTTPRSGASTDGANR